MQDVLTAENKQLRSKGDLIKEGDDMYVMNYLSDKKSQDMSYMIESRKLKKLAYPTFFTKSLLLIGIARATYQTALTFTFLFEL